MPSNTSSITEQLAWEGILSLPVTLLLGCALALFLLRSLFRELPLLGRWAIIFAVLRFIAVTVVLWMLSGPTLQTKHEFTTPHTIALLVDDSGSMSTQDPEEPRRSIRWAAVNSEVGSLSSVANLDRASVALEAAGKQWTEVVTTLQLGRNPATILQQIDRAEALSRRSAEHVMACSTLNTAGDTSRIKRIREELNHVHAALLPECRKRIKTTGSDLRFSGRVSDEVDAIREQLRRTQIRQRQLSMDWVSQSNISSQASSGTRRQLVSRLLNGVEGKIASKSTDTLRIQRYRFADSLSPVEGAVWNRDRSEVALESKITDVSKALEQVAKTASTDSLTAAVLFSDGGHNVVGGASPKQIAASMGGVPIHVVPIGGSKRIRDVVVQDVSAPSVVKHEDSILFAVTITGFECSGESTEVVFRQNGREVERRAVSFQHDREDVRETFECDADQLGKHEFEFSVRPLEDEASEGNNLALATVNVVTGQLKVLLADGRPRWEYRYLEHLFNRDSSVDCDQLLFEPRVVATGARRATGRMPETVDEYSQYNVVILGDLSPQQLSQRSQSALAEFVRERGGNVVVTAGRQNMPEAFEGQPLVPLLPVQKGGTRGDLKTAFTVRLSEEGNQHEAVMITEARAENAERWTEQFRKQPMYFVSDYHRPKPAARTLIEAVAVDDPNFNSDSESAMAMLSWHQVGAGKTAFLSAPATYHLRHRGGDRMHHRFWGQMLRWLASSQMGGDSDIVRLTTDDLRYQLGEPIAVRLTLSEQSGTRVADATINLLAICNDKDVASIELVQDERIPGRYTGTFAALPAGAYQLIPRGTEIDRLLELDVESNTAKSLATNTRLQSVAALVNVVADNNLEMTNTKCNHALLREIAEASGGMVVPPTAVDEILRISAVAPTVTQDIQRQPLWNRWRYLWIVVGCVFVEWFVRKSKGLL